MSMIDGKEITQSVLSGLDMIIGERERQIEEEGFNTIHDSQYKHMELLRAGFSYLCVPLARAGIAESEAHLWVNPTSDMLPEDLWPWEEQWFKPGNDIQCMVKAAALLAAEIDRRINEGDNAGPTVIRA